MEDMKATNLGCQRKTAWDCTFVLYLRVWLHVLLDFLWETEVLDPEGSQGVGRRMALKSFYIVF